MSTSSNQKGFLGSREISTSPSRTLQHPTSPSGTLHPPTSPSGTLQLANSTSKLLSPPRRSSDVENLSTSPSRTAFPHDSLGGYLRSRSSSYER